MPFIKEDKRSFLNRVKIFLNLKYSLREWGRTLPTRALKRENTQWKEPHSKSQCDSISMQCPEQATQ